MRWIDQGSIHLPRGHPRPRPWRRPRRESGGSRHAAAPRVILGLRLPAPPLPAGSPGSASLRSGAPKWTMRESPMRLKVPAMTLHLFVPKGRSLRTGKMSSSCGRRKPASSSIRAIPLAQIPGSGHSGKLAVCPRRTRGGAPSCLATQGRRGQHGHAPSKRSRSSSRRRQRPRGSRMI